MKTALMLLFVLTVSIFAGCGPDNTISPIQTDTNEQSDSPLNQSRIKITDGAGTVNYIDSVYCDFELEALDTFLGSEWYLTYPFEWNVPTMKLEKPVLYQMAVIYPNGSKDRVNDIFVDIYGRKLILNLVDTKHPKEISFDDFVYLRFLVDV